MITSFRQLMLKVIWSFTQVVCKRSHWKETEHKVQVFSVSTARYLAEDKKRAVGLKKPMFADAVVVDKVIW